MKERKKIAEYIQELGGYGQFEIYTGEVDAVDEAKAQIDVKINDGVIIYDVRLKVIVSDDNGLYIVPKVGSFVAIAQMDGGQDYQLLQASEIDKVCLKIGATTWQVTSDGIVIDGGNNFGMVKVDSLVQRLNQLEEALTAIKNDFATHTHTCPDGTSSPPIQPYTYTVPNSIRSDFENQKVKH